MENSNNTTLKIDMPQYSELCQLMIDKIGLKKEEADT